MERPSIPAILGMLALLWSSSVYSAFGIGTYPRQEWLLEVLVSILFALPVLEMLKGPARSVNAVRNMAIALLLHSLWDALHWPGHAWIDTPIDPRIPHLCPWIDLPLGAWLLVRGK